MSDFLIDSLQIVNLQMCLNDPVYFIENYGLIRHPMKGKIKFSLFEYQKKAMREYMTHRRCVLLKSRQMGFSWVAAGYSLWTALFRKESDILLMSKKEDDAKEMLIKVKFLYENLPKFLKMRWSENSASILGLVNGSRIVSLPATEASGRGFSGSLVIIDEAAFIPWGETVFGALKPTLSTGGSIILQSTAPDKGGENMFARILEDYKENGFHRVVGDNEESKKKMMIHWSENPERDERWYEEERPGYTERQWQTEFEGNLVQSSRRVFPEEILKLHLLDCSKTPTNPMGKSIPIEWKNGELGETYCELPLPGEAYAVGLDLAEGLEKGDYTVAQVLKKRNGKQVAVYRTRIPVINATEKVVELAKKYNNAFLVIEDNSIGAVAVQIAKRKYKNLFRRKVYDKKSDVITEKIGWRTTKRSKPLLIRDIELSLRDQEIMLTDRLTRRELWQYSYDGEGGSTSCPNGSNYFDDMVMAFGLAIQGLKGISSPDSEDKFKRIKEKRKYKTTKFIRNRTIGY